MPSHRRNVWVFARLWPRRCFAKDVAIGAIHDSPHGSSAFHGQADRAAQNLRRPGRDRHRERAAVQGTPGAQRGIARSLEHQTATAEVLGIISRSPTDVQPVLDAIVESAARVCGIDDVVLRLREGERYGFAGSFWSHTHTTGRVEISIDEPRFRWMREHGTLHIPDVRAQNDFPTVGSVSDWRTFLAVPLRQQGELIGALIARRTEVRPFTPSADQTARNLRRPGGDRHRERPLVQRIR